MAGAASPFDLSGRVALVTGSGSGLGLALARGLGRAGARVVLNGRNRAKLDAAGATLAADGIAAGIAAFDVTDADAVDAAIAGLAREHGPVDILVNNAAINRRQALEEFSLAQWRELQGANLDGPFLVTRAVIPAMKARRRGKIINICSIASDLGRPKIVAYAVSKGGLKMLTRSLAVELARALGDRKGIADARYNLAFTEHSPAEWQPALIELDALVTEYGALGEDRAKWRVHWARATRLTQGGRPAEAVTDRGNVLSIDVGIRLELG
jgi:gluconate 5-dehydrogenase